MQPFLRNSKNKNVGEIHLPPSRAIGLMGHFGPKHPDFGIFALKGAISK